MSASAALVPSVTLASAASNKSAVLAANTLTRAGYVKRAVSRLIGTNVLAEPCPATTAALRALHPPTSGPIPVLPPAAPQTVVDPELLRRCVMSMDTGSAPGRDGWSASLIRYLVDSETCLKGLVALITDVVNGRVLNREMRARLCESRLLAFTKPDKVHKICPIAIGSCFYRLAAFYILRCVAPPGSQTFKNFQFACGIPGGSQVAIHTIQAALELHGEDAIVVSLDLRNAFNSRNRAHIARALYGRPDMRACYRFFDWSYGSSSPLFLDSDALELLYSEEGVRQGDPLAMLLFCLSL